MEISFLVFHSGIRETHFPPRHTHKHASERAGDRARIPMSKLEFADEQSNARELYILNELFI